MKALEILQKNAVLQKSVEPNYLKEAIKELEELNSVLIDLFTCIEFTEDENAEKRLSSMETYLIRLARFKSE